MAEVTGNQNLINALRRAPLQNVVANQNVLMEKNIFKTALDRAVDSLNSISSQERNAEGLIQDYIQGKAGLDEVMIEIEKANLSINLALTVINTSVQTFKEIMQMPV